MRTNVTFRHPAEFMPVSEDEGILAVDGAAWFVETLRRIDRLVIDTALIQEDWGVVIFVGRGNCRFWIGLNFWDEGAWLAHVHHRSFAWFQRLSARGGRELERLALDLHTALESGELVQGVTWHLEAELQMADAPGASRPDAA